MAAVISTTCESLSKPVKIVSGIVERNQSLPVVSNILIEQSNANVRFTSTDLDIQIQTEAAVGADGREFSFTISAQKIGEILGSLDAQEKVEIDVSNNGQAVLRTSSGDFTMKTLPVRDFPILQSGEWNAEFAITAKKLRYLLSMTSFAMANNDIRYYLNGVLFVLQGERIQCVATDTHRLAYCEGEISDFSCGEEVQVIIPRKTVRELLRILPETDANVRAQFSHSQCSFSFDGVNFISKLIEGRFPDFKRVMPTPETNNRPISISREKLITALKRAQILTNEKFKGVRWIFSKDHLRIIGSNANQEEAFQDLEVEWEWEDLEIGFNVVYLLEVLQSLKTSEIVCRFASSPKSVLLTMPDTMNFQYVIMPMRI